MCLCASISPSAAQVDGVDECSILIAGGRATTAATNETHTHTRTYAQRGERRGGGEGREKHGEQEKKHTGTGVEARWLWRVRGVSNEPKG
jgi:hypothetical protein